ncbi:MAG: shikimate kinase [Verrucomicrobiales bacterium]|nr:shikimate kinase [Verrucomicrobiales bacterium]
MVAPPSSIFVNQPNIGLCSYVVGKIENKANNLILIGFMGTGKTTVGKRVAKSLKLSFVDTDALIVAQEGKSIQSIFEDNGEAAFRALETGALQQACSGEHTIISTGGGIVTQETNLPLLAEGGHVIWLKSSAEVIYERVRRNQERPLIKTENPLETIRQLLAAREELYAKCADLTITTDDLSLEETIYGVTETARFWKINRPSGD